MIYIIAKKTDWEAALLKGFFETASLTGKEGFIHASNEDQVVGSANKHFKGQSGLVLLEVDPAKVKADDLKYENTSGGTALFPHIYGRLQTAAVKEVYAFPVKADGTFELPRLKTTSPAKAIKGANVKPC